MKYWLMIIICISMFIFACDNSTEPSGEEIINVTYPATTTIWFEFQTDTYCDWNNAEGETVYIEIYKGDDLAGIYHAETLNTGHVERSEALGDWGTGTNFRLKVIDSEDNYGWSDYFVIQEQVTGEITVSYPTSSTVWQQYETNTYCEWSNASGNTVNITVYQGTEYKGVYVDETNNDGYYSRELAIDDWGSGNDFRLKVTDSDNNFGWSDYFTIQAASSSDIEVLTPDSTTIWQEFQTNTVVEWANASGMTLDIEVYQENTFKGVYADDINNDGYYSRELALEDWGNGDNMRLKLIDSDGNIGWSDYFTIEAVTPGLITVLNPDAATVWTEFQYGTECDWTGAVGDSVYIEIFQADVYVDLYHNWTANDGHCSQNDALGDWGTGNDFQLKVIDSAGNFGFSDYFTIQALADPITIIYPDANTVWQQFQEDTYCDWINASGATVYVEIYKGGNYLDIYHEETDNDGHCVYNGPLPDWGTGSDFQLKIIDAEGNFDFSDYFTIE